MTLAVGADGHALSDAVDAVEAPAWLRAIPAVVTPRRVRVRRFYRESDGSGKQLYWRTDRQGPPPASLFISSPYDPDAHPVRKRTTQWVGYKVHLTESCEAIKRLPRSIPMAVFQDRHGTARPRPASPNNPHHSHQ